MLDSDIKLLIKFNSSTFYEEYSQSFLTVKGPDFSPVISDTSYKMTIDQYLYGDGLYGVGLPLEISDSATIGFWLYAVSPGMAVNEISGEAESITMPIFDFNDNSSSYKSIIKISEMSVDNDTNKLIFSLDDNNYVAISDSYSVGDWHCFWIVFNGGSNNEVNIYVDGIESSLDETGTVSSFVEGSSLFLYVNHSLSGYAYNLSKNYGYVSDLFLFNTVKIDEQSMQSYINDGIDYITNTDLYDINIDKFSFYFNDPVTTTISSSVNETGFIYVGRDDGSILKGSPLMWETRRIFSDNIESEISDESGILKVKNSTIRF